MILKAPLNLYLKRFWGWLSITVLDVEAIKQLHKNSTHKFQLPTLDYSRGHIETGRTRLYVRKGRRTKKKLNWEKTEHEKEKEKF